MNAAYFQRLADYNAWANRRLYDACGSLDAAAYLAPRPCFFGSIHKTLNHILVGDRIWLARLAGRPSGIASLEHVLYDDFAGLRAAREREDAGLIAAVGAYDEAALAGTLTYRNMAGETRTTPLGLVLGHLFNHQTHHRGQVHCLLSSTAVPPPSLDLIYFDWEKRP